MRSLVALLLALGGCVPGQVVYGDVEPLPIVHTSADRRRWYVVADMGPLGEQVWFLDTGYSITTCDDGFVDQLEVRPKGTVRVQGEAGVLISERVWLPDFELGGHHVSRFSCLVRDLDSTSSIRDPGEVPIAGVLGADLFEHFRVDLDPSRGHMVLHPRSGLGKDDTLPLRREHPFMARRRKLAVQINGRTVRPIVDTGASKTHLDGESLGLPVTRIREGALVRATGGDGSIVRDLLFYDAAVHVGPHRIDDVELTGRASTPWDHGLLGLDVLGHFRQEYDWRGRTVRLTPIEPAELPSWREWKYGSE